MADPEPARTTANAVPVREGNYVLFRPAEPGSGDAQEEGTITIQRGLQVLHTTWKDEAAPAAPLYGLGLELDGRVWLARSATPGGGIGIVRYTLENGTLTPIWAYTVGAQWADQACGGTGTRVAGPEGQFEGRFEIIYRDVGGKPYPFELTIERLGKAYLLTWRQESTVAYRGVGLEDGGALGAAWAPPDEGAPLPLVGVLPDFRTDRSTTGRGDWFQGGDERIGSILLANLG